MSIADKIQKQFATKIRAYAEYLKGLCEEELRNVIRDTVYSRPESDWYKRTGNLLESVTSSDVIVTNNTISFKVYIDPVKLKHFSIAGEKDKGIEAGDEVYTPPILDSGHTGLGVVYEGTDFLNIYIKQIEEDLNKAMLKYIIKEFRTTNYKK